MCLKKKTDERSKIKQKLLLSVFSFVFLFLKVREQENYARYPVSRRKVLRTPSLWLLSYPWEAYTPGPISP